MAGPFDDLIPAASATPAPPPSPFADLVPSAAVAPSANPFADLVPSGKEPGFFEALGKGAAQGVRESLAGTAQTLAAPVKGLPEPEAPKAPTPTEKLLSTPISQGWHDSSWWAANIGHGIGSMGPTVGGALIGTGIGEAVEPAGGGLPGGVGGAAIGSMIQTLVPAYQAARAAGLSHDAAVAQAIKETGIAGVTGAASWYAPALKFFGVTPEGALQRPISEALAQIFGVQPAIGTAGQEAKAAVEGTTPSVGELATGYVTNVASGLPIVGAHVVMGRGQASYASRVAQIESGGDPTAPGGGLYQFHDAAWKDFGAGGDRSNPADQNAALMREAAAHAPELAKTLGRTPTNGELYLAHQQGLDGATRLLESPGSKAVDIVGERAVLDNGGTPDMTAGEFARMWTVRFNGTRGVGPVAPPPEASAEAPQGAPAPLVADIMLAEQDRLEPTLAPAEGSPARTASEPYPSSDWTGAAFPVKTPEAVGSQGETTNESVRPLPDAASQGPLAVLGTPEAVRASEEAPATPETSQAFLRPTPTGRTPALKPIPGTGELTPRGLSTGIEAQAIEKNLADNLGDLPEYRTLNMKDQAQRALTVIAKDPDGAKAIAMGQKAAPPGLHPVALTVALERVAQANGDVETLRGLANSKMAGQITTMAQGIRILGERDPISSVQAIKDVQDARAADLARRNVNLAAATQREMGAARNVIRAQRSTPQTWASFIDAIRCS